MSQLAVLPPEKRRRLNEVQVNLEAEGVAKTRRGEDMTLDFTSNHKEAKKKLSDVEAERDQLLRRLDETSKSHEKALSNAKKYHENTKKELEDAEDEVERSTIGSLDSIDTEISPLIEAIRYLREDHSKTLSRNNKTITDLKKKLQSSQENHRAVSGLLKMRERELEACRDINAKRIDGLCEFNTNFIGEIGSLRSKVTELQDALNKQKQKTIIEL
ncbi:hypothetical protein CSAL01_12397 [Colletotrichum salicis]|uniref:Uncharacterized protein n=1 Tax=Colletotrichum salicis TaxID=1209931 RepID=A0A135U0X2_9PEZI|nr:hypothetical protein CSAL01_12397 [Colletotrichum salicis]